MPLVFVALGLRLEWQGFRGRLASVLIGAVVRLALAPAVVLALAFALGLRGAVRDATVLEASMPSSMMAAVIADQAACDGQLGTGAVVLTTVLAVVTIPVWIAVLHALPGH